MNRQDIDRTRLLYNQRFIDNNYNVNHKYQTNYDNDDEEDDSEEDEEEYEVKKISKCITLYNYI